MMSLRDMSRDAIRRSGMLQNIPGGYERRREVIRNLPNEQSMLLEGLMPAQLSDMPDEILVNILKNSSLVELSNLYYTDERMRGIAVEIVERKYTQEEKDKHLMMYVNSNDTEIAEIARMLINAGADVNYQDDLSRTSLMHASRNGHTEVVRMLLNAGADVNAKDHNGETSLMDASRNGRTEIVRMLINAGADVDAKNNRGYTALMVASDMGRTEIVRMLIQRGADMNAKDNYGETALIRVSSWGRPEMVRMLINAGADPNIQNNQGKTALMLASRNGHTEIEEILRNAAVEGCPAKDNEIQLCDNNMTPRQKKRVYSSPERRERLIRDSHSPPPFLRRPGPSSPERRERLIRDAGRSLRESLSRDRQMRGLDRSIYDPTPFPFFT